MCNSVHNYHNRRRGDKPRCPGTEQARDGRRPRPGMGPAPLRQPGPAATRRTGPAARP